MFRHTTLTPPPPPPTPSHIELEWACLLWWCSHLFLFLIIYVPYFSFKWSSSSFHGVSLPWSCNFFLFFCDLKKKPCMMLWWVMNITNCLIIFISNSLSQVPLHSFFDMDSLSKRIQLQSDDDILFFGNVATCIYPCL